MENAKNNQNIPPNLNIAYPQNYYIYGYNNGYAYNNAYGYNNNAQIIQNNNNNNVNNNNIYINNNNGNNNINFAMNNINNEGINLNDYNREIMKQTTTQNLQIQPNENNNIYSQSPIQTNEVYQQNNDIKKDLGCKEKCPYCFCHIKLLCCYNFLDCSEENKKKRENAQVCHTFFLIAFLYYLFFIISEIIYFVVILIGSIFMILCMCCEWLNKMCEKANEENEKKRNSQAEINRQRLNEINSNINNLDRQHAQMDRRINYGSINENWQKTVISLEDSKYKEERKALERERVRLQIGN